jgi:hypothetical protein
MGTSQSLHLSPNWVSAKRSMTAITKNGAGVDNQNYTQFMQNLFRCIKNANEAYGNGVRGGGRKNAFGAAGRNGVVRFANFFNVVRGEGFDNALGLLFTEEELDNIKPDDFLLRFLEYTRGEEGDSFIDDAAAASAMDEVLSEVFKDCDDMDSIKDVFENADDDKLWGWIVDFEVIYIMEYASTILHSHIFQKQEDPDDVCRQIKEWLRQELMNRLDEEERPTDLFSPQGQQYISSLTDKIIGIWG